LCRGEAARIYAQKKAFDTLGCKLVCVLKEGLPAEVAEFKDNYWRDELYLDKEMGFFKAVAGGKVKKGNLSTFLNPFSTVWKRVTEAKEAGVQTQNLNGEGKILGGLLVMRPGSRGVEYQFQERNFGDSAPVEDVLKAVEAAALAK